jgi:hypothetical protein
VKLCATPAVPGPGPPVVMGASTEGAASVTARVTPALWTEGGAGDGVALRGRIDLRH